MSDTQTETHTNNATSNICNNGPHLALLAMQVMWAKTLHQAQEKKQHNYLVRCGINARRRPSRTIYLPTLELIAQAIFV